MLISVKIQNTGRRHVNRNGGGIELPPPFHLLDIAPGGVVEVVCTKDQIDDYWPHDSGFRVADLLQQHVQRGSISIDISAYGQGDFQEETSLHAPVESVIEIEEDMPQGDLMGTKDDFPDFLDPLYNAPASEKKRDRKPSSSDEPTAEETSDPLSGSGISLPDPGELPYGGKKKESNKDTFEAAVKMAFVGAGQGGGRIAQSFYDMGYRRVCAVNTTSQDLSSLTIQNKLIIGNNRGGAGKDPEQGRLAAKESFEDIMDLLMRSWGEGVEQMWVCVGAGGGSGTGSWPVLVKAIREFGSSTNVEAPIEKHLGIIMTMPKRSEGSRVQQNALIALQQAVDLVEAEKISSLVIVDNAKIHDLYPGLPVKKFWKTANQNFAAILHTFNLLAAQDSEFNTFDRADFRSVIRNGIMIFGMTRVHDWEHKEDVSMAIRQNLTGSLLADGFDLSKANMAGAIVVAHDDVLEEVPMENIDYAFNSLGRALGNEGVTLHSGIYEWNRPGMMVFTIVSGLQPPQGRFAELEKLAT